MTQKNHKKILLANDDGIDSPGLLALWEALECMGQLIVVAPMHNQSGKGLSVSCVHDIKAERASWPKKTEAWKVLGTPVDCVNFALHALQVPPDFIISGINDGLNAGGNARFSGTVGAALQGAMHGIPSVAFSCSIDHIESYQFILPYIQKITSHFMHNSMPTGTAMNVNFPHNAKNIVGFRMATQGKNYWTIKKYTEYSSDQEIVYPHSHGWTDSHKESQDSDIFLLQKGFITCVPLCLCDLTDYKNHDKLKFSFEEKLNATISASTEKEIYQ